MDNNVQELLNMLYVMIEDAWHAPVGPKRCIIDREKALDLLDDIRRQLPRELEDARKLMSTRNEYVANAKKEADQMQKLAEEKARRMVNQEEIVRQAKARADSIVSAAESKSNELRRVANAYADDLLQRTESALNEAMGEVRSARAKFKSVTASLPQSQRNPIVPDGDL